MDTHSFWNKTVLGLRYWEIAAVSVFYIFFGFSYDLTLYLTAGGEDHYRIYDVMAEYGLTAFLTFFIWWLIFKKFGHWKFWKRMMLHLLVLPPYLFGRQAMYYAITDYFGLGHLPHPACWWDIYIPFLFYVLQFGVFHGYEYHLKLKREEKLQTDLRELALKSELTALKAQLNPHFLYNTFNTISASVPAGQEDTREMIAKFSDLFRYQLKGSKEEFVPLVEELNFVKTYLELEKERFGERLQFNFDIENELDELPVPPMILQPIVENAVKHGISPQIEGGAVNIKVHSQNQSLHFEICDTGIGLKEDFSTNQEGIGLTNTKKRLEKMYESQLEIENKKGGGVCVKFDIPKSLT